VVRSKLIDGRARMGEHGSLVNCLRRRPAIDMNADVHDIADLQ